MSETVRLGTGEIGGKAKGFLLARSLLETKEVRAHFPQTFCIGTDVFDAFLLQNRLLPIIEQCCQAPEKQYDTLRKKFLEASFPKDTSVSLERLLEKITFPLAVRSSSLLEDRPGTSFAGKYETTFLSNRGPIKERLASLCRAIASIYASTFNPNAMTYRRKRGLLDEEEKMAILLQEAIGREYEGKFLPLVAGVGFSKNDYCWSPTIRREDGLARLVFGLGTRAVGRGYARLFSPGKPMARPEGMDAAQIERFSQGMVDVLDLSTNELLSVHFSEIVKDGVSCYPGADRIFSLRDGAHLYSPVSNVWNISHRPVITFDRVLAGPWLKLHLPTFMRDLFLVLEEGFGMPVDLEFAVRVDEARDEAHFYLVQARPLSQRESMSPVPVPRDVPKEDQLFSANRNVPSGRLDGIEYIVSVDAHRYHEWPLEKRHEVARAVGEINPRLAGKTFILMGPGRWGSVNPLLGVPTTYAEISNCAMLVEVAEQKEGYAPEVSYGTHFFQDLIEDGIIYLPLYPGEPGNVFHEKFLQTSEELIRVVHIPAVTGGRFASAALDGTKGEALIYLA